MISRVPRTPEVKTNDAIIALACAGASVEDLAKDFKLSKRALIKRIRSYPELVDIKMSEQHPVKYERIMKGLRAGSSPSKVAAICNVNPPIVYALRDHNL